MNIMFDFIMPFYKSIGVKIGQPVISGQLILYYYFYLFIYFSEMESLLI